MATMSREEELIMRSIMAERYGKKAAGVKQEVKNKPTEPDFIDIDSVGEDLDPIKFKKYSELFGWDEVLLKDKPDFLVRVYDDSEWTENDLKHIPAKDTDREVDHTYNYPFVLSLQKTGMIPMLVGPTGSGKTTAIEYYCAVINQPYLRINSRGDMESDEIIGRPWSKGSGSGMEFLIGTWPKATAAGWLVLWDEPWKAPSGIVMAAQRHMEGKFDWQIEGIPGELDDKTIAAKDSYRLVLADNVVGSGDNADLYGATNIQDSSSLNRIGVVLNVPYLTEDKECALITRKHPYIPEKKAKQMVKMLNFIRHGFDSRELAAPASMRNIEKWAELAYDVKNYEVAFKWVMLHRYADDAERAAIRNHYFTVFGKELAE